MYHVIPSYFYIYFRTLQNLRRADGPMVRGLSSDDAVIHRYDDTQQVAIQQQKLWLRNPHYFKQVRVSALALFKMTLHCRSGSSLEVMGMLQGKTIGDAFVVLDTFPLPVEGTETRVNAQAEAYEYMVEFVQTSRLAGRREYVIGW
mgnify:CR=1 FL=1